MTFLAFYFKGAVHHGNEVTHYGKPKPRATIMAVYTWRSLPERLKNRFEIFLGNTNAGVRELKAYIARCFAARYMKGYTTVYGEFKRVAVEITEYLSEPDRIAAYHSRDIFINTQAQGKAPFFTPR